MRYLLFFIKKYQVVVVFIILELISFSFIINNQFSFKNKWVNSSNSVVGSVYQFQNNIQEYVSLRKQNEKILQENKELYQLLKNLNINDSSIVDTINQYEFIPAKVINGTTLKKRNFLTINKGSKHGIESDMAVIYNNAVVGKVIQTSSRYSIIIPVINEKFKIGIIHKKTGVRGIASWDTKNINLVQINNISSVYEVGIGDSIFTKNDNHIFPNNTLLGTVENKVKDPQSNFYHLDINLITDFNSLENVYMVKNAYKQEIDSLENQFYNHND